MQHLVNFGLILLLRTKFSLGVTAWRAQGLGQLTLPGMSTLILAGMMGYTSLGKLPEQTTLTVLRAFYCWPCQRINHQMCLALLRMVDTRRKPITSQMCRQGIGSVYSTLTTWKTSEGWGPPHPQPPYCKPQLIFPQ